MLIAADRAALHEVAFATGGLTVDVGFPDADEDVYNGAAVRHDAGLGGVERKQYLPTHAVFDKARAFHPGERNWSSPWGLL